MFCLKLGQAANFVFEIETYYKHVLSIFVFVMIALILDMRATSRLNLLLCDFTMILLS